MNKHDTTNVDELPELNLPDLKPCPFCGSHYVQISLWTLDGDDSLFFYVDCEPCGAHSGLHHSTQEAAEAWNKRRTKKQRPMTAKNKRVLAELLIKELQSYAGLRED